MNGCEMFVYRLKLNQSGPHSEQTGTNRKRSGGDGGGGRKPPTGAQRVLLRPDTAG